MQLKDIKFTCIIGVTSGPKICGILTLLRKEDYYKVNLKSKSEYIVSLHLCGLEYLTIVISEYFKLAKIYINQA